MSIGANIRKRRFELKMTQQELADAMGYKCRATIAKIESGENDITQTKLQHLAKILDTTVTDLLAGTDSINLPSSYPISSSEDNRNGSKKTKTAAIIMAGGKSSRNQQNIPSQFIMVVGKPIIAYCLEAYQHHPSVDDIYIVCLKGWESIVKAYAEQFHITKLRGIIPAGSTGILSVKNGLDYVNNNYNDDDIVIFQESTRPMVSAEMISKLLQTVDSIGSASICQSMKDYVQFSVTTDNVSYVNRDSTVELQSPESFTFKIIRNAFEQAKKEKHNLTESCCALLLYNLGMYINFIEGSTNNIKIIRQEDIAIFKSLKAQSFQ